MEIGSRMGDLWVGREKCSHGWWTTVFWLANRLAPPTGRATPSNEGFAWTGSDRFGQVWAVSELGQVRTGSRRTWSEPVRTCPELGSGAELELVQNGGIISRRVQNFASPGVKKITIYSFFRDAAQPASF